MKVIAPTIMHTGSHLLWYQVLRLQYQACDQDYLFGPETGNELVMTHIDGRSTCLPEFPTEKDLEEHLVFSTLRHPRRVAASFERACRERESYDIQWAYMINRLYPYVDQFLVIDDPTIRDFQVGEIARLTGLPIKMGSWKPNPHQGGARRGTWKLSVDECPQTRKKFQSFYDMIVERERARFNQ